MFIYLPLPQYTFEMAVFCGHCCFLLRLQFYFHGCFLSILKFYTGISSFLLLSKFSAKHQLSLETLQYFYFDTSCFCWNFSILLRRQFSIYTLDVGVGTQVFLWDTHWNFSWQFRRRYFFLWRNKIKNLLQYLNSCNFSDFLQCFCFQLQVDNFCTMYSPDPKKLDLLEF